MGTAEPRSGRVPAGLRHHEPRISGGTRLLQRHHRDGIGGEADAAGSCSACEDRRRE